MKLRNAGIIALLLAGMPGAAGAAETVLGKGAAHDCFMQAQRPRDLDTAIGFCDKALTTDVLPVADRARTLINRGILLTLTKDRDAALRDFAAALAIGNNDGAVYLNRSATFIALKRYDEALEDANRAIALGASRLEIAYYNRGLANEELGNIGAAFEDYKTALRVEPRLKAASLQLRRFHAVGDDAKGT